MNRRGFLKLLGAAGVAAVTPEAILARPHQRFWKLDKTMNARTLTDDQFIRWHMARGMPVPVGSYQLKETIVLDPAYGRLLINGSHLEFVGTETGFLIPRGSEYPDQEWNRIENCIVSVGVSSSGIRWEA